MGSCAVATLRRYPEAHAGFGSGCRVQYRASGGWSQANHVSHSALGMDQMRLCPRLRAVGKRVQNRALSLEVEGQTLEHNRVECSNDSLSDISWSCRWNLRTSYDDKPANKDNS
eukprot:3525786-Amphidinium_carterae.1